MTGPASEGVKPGPRIAQGREAEVFAWGSAQVLKLFRDPGAREWAEREVAAIRAAAGCVRVPAVERVVTVDGRPGIVMERLQGEDLLTFVSRAPWRLRSAARLTAEAQAALHRAAAPPELPRLKAALRAGIERGDSPAGLRRRALDALDRVAEGDRLCHGDLHPGNIILCGGEPVVIDWGHATAGAPAGDFARSVILLECGALPPGSSIVDRALAAGGRRLLAWRFAAEYRRQRAGSLDDYALWRVASAADRLGEGLPGERGALMRMVRR